MSQSLIVKYTLSALFTPLLFGCSSTPDEPRRAGDYSMLDSTQSFIDLNDTRRNGAIVDKGTFYPKDTYAFAYRYCSTGEDNAQRDIAEYHTLAKRVCDANNGSLIHQKTATWCVANPNTVNEMPLFSARISSTDLWADLCLDGPFVTLRLNENAYTLDSEWREAAQILGYQPYTAHRQLVPNTTVDTPLHNTPQPAAAPKPWSNESQYIYSNIGTTVCYYDQSKTNALGYTYRGQVFSVKEGLVKVLTREKIKGDIRTAPVWEQINWHDKAFITAPASAWFVCES
ncbi:hypothetical protein L4C36_07815 [Photobacterium japonica]|uniref:hypothetical protein n=1 Tax=Photobacterium japonica TaxID=2910235 RepID=UPI003D0C3557